MELWNIDIDILHNSGSFLLYIVYMKYTLIRYMIRYYISANLFMVELFGYNSFKVCFNAFDFAEVATFHPRWRSMMYV